jgi:hypothetical protein
LDLAVALYNKTTYTHNKFNLGAVNVFQAFTNAWIHSSLQFGWQDSNGNDYYLRANAGKKYEKINPLHYLNNLTANYIYKLNANNNLGVEVLFALFSSEAIWLLGNLAILQSFGTIDALQQPTLESKSRLI